MTKTDLTSTNLSIYLPNIVIKKIDKLNENSEKSSSLALGRSFIIRTALEEFFKRDDIKDVLVERKIDQMHAKVLA